MAEKDLWGNEIKFPEIYWSESMAEDEQIDTNGLIRRDRDGERLLAHRGMGWTVISELPRDAKRLREE